MQFGTLEENSISLFPLFFLGFEREKKKEKRKIEPSQKSSRALETLNLRLRDASSRTWRRAVTTPAVALVEREAVAMFFIVAWGGREKNWG